MLTALTRAVSRSIESCELTWVPRQKIDVTRAIEQHRAYEQCLAELGVRVISLPEQPDLPDAVFVEDPLVVVDEIAVVAPMGCESRRAESDSLADAIAPFRPLRRLREPAKLEGGDVMRIGRTLFVGLSSRTDEAGIEGLADELDRFGYRVTPVEIRGCLHLKSACCSLSDGAILANRAWLDTGSLRRFRILDVPIEEPHAANVLRIGGTIIMPAAFPRTERMLRNEGFAVRTVDISELMKAEAAVTCSSVIFETSEYLHYNRIAMSATAFLADPIAKEHDTGRGHPERAARWDAAVRGLKEHRFTEIAARSATEDELALCHSAEYIRIARRDVEQGLSALSTGDTDICPRSFDVALRAAGLCLQAVDLVMSGEAPNAFSVVRPPGHHATPTRGMGFCLFNNIAIAARYAQRRHGIERAAIVDWDVHHGNGTQDIFYRDPSVFFFSTHQYPWYPGTGAADETGEGDGRGSTLNCPFPAGAGRDQILGAFRERWAPRMDEFRPDLILISAGFDSRLGDPLGHFRLADADFADLTTLVMEIADKHSGGRVISVLEGGYNLDGLERAVSAHAGALTAR